jgi:hypothetical protein
MVMTPQLKQLIDFANSDKKSVNYRTKDGKLITVVTNSNILSVSSEDPRIVILLSGIIDLALKGQLQRKPLTKGRS